MPGVGFHDKSGSLAIRGASAVVPGYHEAGGKFGSLVPTSEILAGIQPGRPRTATPLSENFLASHLGIRSVATTHTTREVAERAVDSGLDAPEAAARVPRPVTNPEVEEMLIQAVSEALERAGQFSPPAAHVHIAPWLDEYAMFSVARIRQAAGCDRPGLPVFYLLSGCAAMLTALQQARYVLETAGDGDATVLITCSNDMLPLAHMRARCPADQNTDINSWLFGAIFGEGAGALIVGPSTYRDGSWVVRENAWWPVTDDWRVRMTLDQQSSSMDMRAREVSATYRANVPRAAQLGLSALDLTGFDELHRLCLHESNPRLVAETADRVGAPPEVVPSISADVGTLAAVSGFTLLAEALATDPGSTAGGVVCALIGETGNGVTAGYLALEGAPSRS